MREMIFNSLLGNAEHIGDPPVRKTGYLQKPKLQFPLCETEASGNFQILFF